MSYRVRMSIGKKLDFYPSNLGSTPARVKKTTKKRSKTT